MASDEQIGRLEALLFIHGEPLPFKKIETTLGVTRDEARELIAGYETRLRDAGRGLALVSDEENVQLVTKPEYRNLLEAFIKDQFKEDLTSAAVETLALIAYLGPLSRTEIEYHRGVHSAFILRSLLLRGLIDRSPHPKFHNAYVYAPSFELLKHLGIGTREELPEYAAFRNFFAEAQASSVADVVSGEEASKEEPS